MKKQPKSKSRNALFVIDYQLDFLLMGSLGAQVPVGPTNPTFSKEIEKCQSRQNKVTHKILELIDTFKDQMIISSADEHPSNHVSFLNNHIDNKEGTNEAEKNYLKGGLNDLPGSRIAWLCYDTKALTDNQNTESVEKYQICNVIYGDETNARHKIEKYQTKFKVVKQNLWPEHCIGNLHSKSLENSATGVAIEPKVKGKLLTLNKGTYSHYAKGIIPSIESYSIIKNNLGVYFNDIPERLEAYRPNNIFVCGVATDYCVFSTARDLAELNPNYKVYIVLDASIAIVEGAVNKMIKGTGVSLVESAMVPILIYSQD